MRLQPKLEAAKRQAAKLEASNTMLEAASSSLKRFVVVHSFKPLAGSLKLGGQELGGFQLGQFVVVLEACERQFLSVVRTHLSEVSQECPNWRSATA